ncbi:MAG: acylneuraminate cytidylyltransferase family protein [Nitrospiraceae bacterium]|nr:MAG: acylneuraminate cytidylyltransferase family protein [Nitrospiraceae bacterium]
MYNNNVILCVIPARGGSKGLPGKNTKHLLGKPLIGYTIEQARQSKYIDRIIVSTEDPLIAEVAKKFTAETPFIRPRELAEDNSSTLDVLVHAIRWMEERENYRFDILVLLHVTTPLRYPEDIDNCISLLVDEKADNVFSVTEAQRNPYFNMVEISGNNEVTLVKKGVFATRQSAPEVYDMNSSIYVWWKDTFKAEKGLFLKKTRIYTMPRERSIDIDGPLDFRIAEMLLQDKQLS